MLLISDGYSEYDTLVLCKLGELTCLKHLFSSTAVVKFEMKKYFFSIHICATISELPNDYEASSACLHAARAFCRSFQELSRPEPSLQYIHPF